MRSAPRLKKGNHVVARQVRHASGVCVRGDGNTVQPGKKLCNECRIRDSDRQKHEYVNLKHLVIDGYGGCCKCCGETISTFLTVDHIHNDGAKERNQANYSLLNLYRRIILEDFPPEYRLLCFNCNCGRAKNGGICPHTEETK